MRIKGYTLRAAAVLLALAAAGQAIALSVPPVMKPHTHPLHQCATSNGSAYEGLGELCEAIYTQPDLRELLEACVPCSLSTRDHQRCLERVGQALMSAPQTRPLQRVARLSSRPPAETVITVCEAARHGASQATPRHSDPAAGPHGSDQIGTPGPAVLARQH